MPVARAQSWNARWLVALPVVGAIAVAGGMQVFGGSGPDDGSITLTGAGHAAPAQAAVKVPVASDVAARTSTSSSGATAPAAHSGGPTRKSRYVRAPARPGATVVGLRSTSGGGVTATTGDPASTPTIRIATRATTTSSSSAVATSTRTSTTSSSSATAATTSAGTTSNGSFVDKVVELTNAQRLKNSCKPLTVNAVLTSAAQAHSADMAKRNFFDHNNPDGKTPFARMTAAGYRYSMAAENIAAGYLAPRAVVDGWMNSEGHRKNILNCGLTEIGVGYAAGGAHGTYWTQDFGTPLR